MVTGSIIAALVLIIGVEGFLAWRMGVRAWTAETKLAAADAGLRGAHGAAERFRKLFLQRDEEVTSLRERESDLLDRMDEVRRTSRARYEQREAGLLAQIQTLSNRMASLRLQPVGEGDEQLVVIDEGDTPLFADESIPYSADLHDFVKAMESEDARQMVEDFVEERRANHEDDAQILQKLQRGEY